MGQAIVDVVILAPACWLAVLGWIAAESPSRQNFPPPTQVERTESVVLAGAAWIGAAVLVAMVLARSRHSGWRAIARYRTPAIALVLASWVGFGSALVALSFGSPIGVAIGAMVVGVLVLAVELLRRPSAAQ